MIAPNVYVSEISRIEVLGYHKLTNMEESCFKDIFELIPILLPNSRIFNKAIEIRKAYNLKLGDSLIAATALENDLSIYTRNLADFKNITELTSINPIP
jgi:predicted nucleic acid-binding protein